MSLQPGLLPPHRAIFPLARARKVKVTYLLGSLRDAGTERQALALMRQLDRQHFSLSLILSEADGVEKLPQDIDLYCGLGLPPRGASWFRSALCSVKAMGQAHARFLDLRPDIVHAFLPGPSLLGVVAARLARVPVFIGSRRSLVAVYRRQRPLVALADRLGLRLAHVNLGNSSAVSREMVALAGCPPQKAETIYNGVDTRQFHPRGSGAWRTALGWDESHVVFGMVANFYAYKRHLDFVEAARAILAHCRSARFVMAGADYGQRETIAKAIGRLGLQSEIRILDASPCPEEIISGLDALVSASETEGCSNVLLEAMACAKPVIATNVGGNPELVQEGTTGFLVPAGSPAAIAAAALKLLDRKTRIGMGRLGRRRVERHFSLERMVASHERLYLRLLADRKAKRV